MSHGSRTRSVVVVLALVVGACGTAPADPPVAATAGEPGSVNAFAFDLLDQLDAGERTVIVSPVSVAVLLGMVLAGADGETARAIARTLHVDDTDASFGELLRGLDDDEVTIEAANALWANLGVRLREGFQTFVAAEYGAEASTADLGAEGTVTEIDAWVDEHTEGLITEFARGLGLPDPQAVVVLLNAVYFKGEWRSPFPEGATRPGPFTLGSGERVDVPMMHLEPVWFGHATRDGYEVLRLPYGEGGRYGMELFLPDDGLSELLERLDADEWASATDGLRDREIGVVLPKIDLTFEATLNEALSALGMGIAFAPGADLSRMSTTDAWLSVVAHKARVIVDEEGTEAAAVTGGVTTTSARVEPPPVFRVDRPYVFTISDGQTIVFAGAVTDPRD